MAKSTQGHFEGRIQGQALTDDVQDKIEAVLKTTLEAELAKEKPTTGTALIRRPGHGSITHGSVTQV